MPPKRSRPTLASGLSNLADQLSLDQSSQGSDADKDTQIEVAEPVIRKSARITKLNSVEFREEMKVQKSIRKSPTRKSKEVLKEIKQVKPRKVKPDFQIPSRYTITGEVFIMGSGECEQLGLGDDIFEAPKPTKIPFFASIQIVQVFAGGMHSIALSNTGKLYSWGCNDQFALGRTGAENLPMEISALDDVVIVEVACGDSISVALTEHGKIYAWGTFRGNNGTFGFRPNINVQKTPYLIPELSNIVALKSGTNHILCLAADGKVYTFGVDEQGQLGRRVVGRRKLETALIPRVVTLPGHVKLRNIWCGGYDSFFEGEDGEIYACGLNNYGQLGVGKTDFEEHFGVEKIKLPDGCEVQEIVGGLHHTLMVSKKGNAYAWGRGDSGELGLDSEENRDVPTLISSLSAIASVSAGSAFSFAVHKANSENDEDVLYAWGFNENGQLGLSMDDEYKTPEAVRLNGRKVLGVGSGGQHVVLLLGPKVAK
ncbi:Regulator of chromosome condensation [Nowakowskiella sp. JEL0407]|nr:Regulator of chromosome condensation [Nowakowskiella sp. JEL0407]